MIRIDSQKTKVQFPLQFTSWPAFAGSKTRFFVPQNGQKCNNLSITAHKLPQIDQNQMLIHFCIMLAHFETTSVQQYKDTMNRAQTPAFCARNIRQNGQKCYNLSITVQKLPLSNVNHILLHFCTLLGHFDTMFMQHIKMLWS